MARGHKEGEIGIVTAKLCFTSTAVVQIDLLQIDHALHASLLSKNP